MQAVNLLHGVRLIFQEKGRDAPTKAVIILSESGASDPDQSLNWDADRLLIKRDGFSEQDVTKIERVGQDLKLKLVLAPGSRQLKAMNRINGRHRGSHVFAKNLHLSSVS